MMPPEKKFEPKKLVGEVLDSALTVQYPIAAKNVDRLRRVHPDKSPAELISFINKTYIATVTATGAATGASAAIPNGIVQVPAALADVAAFLEASVLYSMSVAEITGLDLDDTERRRLLVMTILMGEGATKNVLSPIIDHTVPFWGKKIVKGIPMAAIDSANKVLGPRFITKYGTKQGVLVLGKQVPYFLGVGIGAAGNGAFGWATVRAARRILGPPPDSWEQRDAGSVIQPDATTVIDVEWTEES